MSKKYQFLFAYILILDSTFIFILFFKCFNIKSSFPPAVLSVDAFWNSSCCFFELSDKESNCSLS